MGDRNQSNFSEDYWSLAGRQAESPAEVPGESTGLHYCHHDDSRVDTTRDISSDKSLGQHDGDDG